MKEFFSVLLSSPLFAGISEEELAVYKRGRNANGSHVPKNADPAQYRRATGLEALFGYLYLNECYDRVTALYEQIYRAATEKEEGNESID